MKHVIRVIAFAAAVAVPTAALAQGDAPPKKEAPKATTAPKAPKATTKPTPPPAPPPAGSNKAPAGSGSAATPSK